MSPAQFVRRCAGSRSLATKGGWQNTGRRTAGPLARPSNKRLSGSHDPDDVTLWIGQQRDRRLGGDLRERHDDPPTARRSLVEDALGIVGVHVERHVAGAAVLTCADPACDAVVLSVHAVSAGVVRIEPPAEHALVELLWGAPLLAGDLDVDVLGSHRDLLRSRRLTIDRPVSGRR